MFYSPKLFVRDRWIFSTLGLSVVCLLAMWWRTLFFIKSSLGQVYLHYTSIFGVDLVGDWWRIFFLPAGGILLLVVNFVLGLWAYRDDNFLARFLGVATLLIEIFLLIGVWLIVGLNI